MDQNEDGIEEENARDLRKVFGVFANTQRLISGGDSGVPWVRPTAAAGLTIEEAFHNTTKGTDT